MTGDVLKILQRDLERCTRRLERIIERKKKLPSLRGDHADVERRIIKLESESVTATSVFVRTVSI